MGVNPYINASIIMQLMTGVVPRLQALSREGEYGRTKINQYTRYLTVPLALLQAYGYLAILSSSNIVTDFDILSLTTLGQMVTLAAGTVLAMWIGELITERGIGNGISFIIFAGIVARVPQGVATFLANPDIAGGVAFVILAIVVVAVIVYIQEGQRRIPIQYASRVRGRRMYQGGATFLPLRVNQAGVIPIIFAVSILLFPTQIASYFQTPVGGDAHAGQPDRRRHRRLPQPAGDPVHPRLLPADDGLHVLLHGVHLQARRDGRPTAQERRLHPGHPARRAHARLPARRSSSGSAWPARSSWRIIAVSPIILSAIFQGGVVGGFALGGTALLIVVSVVVETMKQIEAQLMMRNYEGFIR